MKFPAQLHSFRKTTLGDILITISVDRSFSSQLTELIQMETGAQINVVLEQEEEITEETNNKGTKERFFSKMHALCSQLSEKQPILFPTQESVKNTLKVWLKEQGMIKESTTELDIKGLAKACNHLEEMINL